jgi:hypothetical protein
LFQIINKFEDFLSTLPFFDEIEEWSKWAEGVLSSMFFKLECELNRALLDSKCWKEKNNSIPICNEPLIWNFVLVLLQTTSLIRSRSFRLVKMFLGF